MSPLALARRYRPRTFQTMIGQEVVLRALSNALDNKRLHHAYLFTGTRGIGKTSIARILAKCLNCEQGISSAPCGQCSACQDIDQGHFIDLIEVDAASRTKVEDTRELLENVQYLPSRGRFKIYLIDEVHMLSAHSFNALLKTLEEPPSHVKFLLATTDPQKLPVTVLSRCLQFHLRRVAFEKIVDFLAGILQQESATFEKEALLELSRAADGSLRDALSLLEQALSFGNGRIETEAVRLMLGLSDKELLFALLIAVIRGNTREILEKVALLAEKTPDFAGVLTELLTLIHQIMVAQNVPEALEPQMDGRETILKLAAEVSAEELQLYYQIGLQGQRDLCYAPNPKMGFEITLLRMVAFQPARISSFEAKTPEKPSSAPIVERKENIPHIEKATSIPDKEEQEAKFPKTKQDTPLWPDVVNRLNLSGLTKVMADNCVISVWQEGFIHLTLDNSQKLLLNKRYEERLQEALCQYLGRKLVLKITEGKITEETPAAQNQRIISGAHETARQMFEVDSKIQTLIQAFDAKIEQVLLKDE